MASVTFVSYIFTNILSYILKYHLKILAFKWLHGVIFHICGDNNIHSLSLYTFDIFAILPVGAFEGLNSTKKMITVVTRKKHPVATIDNWFHYITWFGAFLGQKMSSRFKKGGICGQIAAFISQKVLKLLQFWLSWCLCR